MTNTSNVKLGKISKDIQRKLGVDFGDKDKVYILEHELNAIANQDPQGYLNKIHEASSIIQKPDIAFYNKDKKCIHLVKLYFINETFSIVGVSLEKQGQFYFSKFYVLNEKTKYNIFEGLEGVIV